MYDPIGLQLGQSLHQIPHDISNFFIIEGSFSTNQVFEKVTAFEIFHKDVVAVTRLEDSFEFQQVFVFDVSQKLHLIHETVEFFGTAF